MRIADALNVLGLEGATDIGSCEKAYRRAAMKYHPDRTGGGADMMKACNAAIAAIRSWYADADNEPLRPHDNPTGYGDALAAALNILAGLEGLEIEICGSWVWVGGETKAHKTELKAAGYRWGAKKLKWYFRPDGYKKRGKGTWSMDKIRDHHGSQAYRAGAADDKPQQKRAIAQ